MRQLHESVAAFSFLQNGVFENVCDEYFFFIVNNPKHCDKPSKSTQSAQDEELIV